MVWDNKKILMCVAAGMLWNMANVALGKDDRDEPWIDTDEPGKNTIERMLESADSRRRSTWIKIVGKSTQEDLQRIISTPSSSFPSGITWAVEYAGLYGKSKFDGIIDKLIAAGVDPAERNNPDFSSALHSAAIPGCCKIMKRLLNRYGLDPNMQTNSGITALHYAAAFGHLGCVLLLLKCSADPNMQDENGEIPLDWAIRVRKKMWGKENRKKSKRYRELFHVGSREDYDKIIRLLRRVSAN